LKKIILTFLICAITTTCANAIQWEKRTSTFGRVVYLDIDSIKETSDYFFYNIKFRYENNENYIILTMQSKKTNPFSARIKAYTENEYNSLEGDYDNITANQTDKMEPVTFDSIVYACYRRVKQIKTPRNDIKIIN